MDIELIDDEPEEKDEENIEPGTEPECTASPEEIEQSGIECEFNIKDGSWWCSTHNCPA